MFDLLEKAGLNQCFRCGTCMTVDDYSVEHKEPWLLADNPLEAFFDLNNVSFSHLKCNREAARKKPPSHGNTTSFGKRKCRCKECVEAKRIERAKYASPAKRRERYLRTGN